MIEIKACQKIKIFKLKVRGITLSVKMRFDKRNMHVLT